MTQAIATVGSVAVNVVGEVSRPPLPGENQQRTEAIPQTRSSPLTVPETRAAARQNAETQGRYQVHIHAETMRIITEVVDMATGDVVMYFPPGYRPDAQPKRSDGDKSADSADK